MKEKIISILSGGSGEVEDFINRYLNGDKDSFFDVKPQTGYIPEFSVEIHNPFPLRKKVGENDGRVIGKCARETVRIVHHERAQKQIYYHYKDKHNDTMNNTNN